MKIDSNIIKMRINLDLKNQENRLKYNKMRINSNAIKAKIDPNILK